MKERPELSKLIEQAKLTLSQMDPLAKEEMFRKQREGWAKAEAQWAKDFREGKCKRD